MKNLFLFLILCMGLYSCKKEPGINPSSSGAQDSLSLQDSATISAAENPNAIRVESVSAQPGLGKVVFTHNGLPIIAFDTQDNSGTVKLNGKEYPLSHLSFSENNYEISGSSVKINAENGNFEEMVSDCNYGVFSEITIRLNQDEVKVENVKVQDCPNYN